MSESGVEVRLAAMTWREAERARDRGATVLFPMGSTEEHGPHSPMGDYMAAEAVAVRAAEATGDVVVPALPYSCSEYFRDFPGTASLSWHALSSVVEEVALCYLDQGFERVVIVNGHKGNEPVLLHLVRKLRRERGVMVPVVSVLGLALTPGLTQELYGGQRIAHGAEPMGSIMRYLFPEMSKLEAIEPHGMRDYHGVPIGSLNGLAFEDSEVLLPLNMSDVAPPSGSMSDPSLASSERGERIVTESAAKLVRFLRWWRTLEPVAPERPAA